ncbi:MAG: TrbI/VirB10 family protein [Alphaproteobacteria bacterium]
MVNPNDILPPPNMKPAAGKGKDAPPAQQMLQKFRALPQQAQVVLGVVVLAILAWLVFGGRGQQQVEQGQLADLTTRQAVQQGADAEQKLFTGLETDTPELMKSWFDQSQRDLADLKDTVEGKLNTQDQTLSAAIGQNEQLQQQIKQYLEDFKSEIVNMQEQDRRDREVLGQLAEETRKLQLNAPAPGQVQAVQGQAVQRRINQTPLGGAQLGSGPEGQALLGGVANAAENVASGRPLSTASSEGYREQGAYGDMPENPPFLPPLGFVKGTLLNGVDALVGGTPTPSLARLEGQYKTAMNSTVLLDGCFMLIEFNGEISTERAIGKPSRMTCVYPDRGAVTYSVSGYVVDAEDGIIGVPGIFYEGDATRLATAMVADFAAGVAQVVEQNQQTTTVSADGTTNTALTGEQTKAQVAGGAGKAMSSLRDYLFERANRVVPFVRVDATRTLHMVLLSGVELRPEGNAWSLLFDAEAADSGNDSNSAQAAQ